MSTRLIIHGGKEIAGTIDVRGSKNAALPIIASTVLTEEPCRISNVPRVLDVERMLSILERMGGIIKQEGNHTVTIQNKNLDLEALKSDTVKQLRASILFLGPLLRRFGKVCMRYPGGCKIGARSIDTHLTALRDLGGDVYLGRKYFSVEFGEKASFPNALILKEFSVTATENVMMFLSSVPKTTFLKIAASEPHIQDLAKFLSKMGATIRGAGTSNVVIKGREKLSGASHRIVPDYIEAGTFLLLALCARGNVRIKNAPVSQLDLVLKTLIANGAHINLNERESVIETRGGIEDRGFGKIQILPHPGIPTDLQSAFGVLATQTKGSTLIHEPLYEDRFHALRELTKMGASVKILDPHRAMVTGPSKLKGVDGVVIQDLRGGAALVIAALIARGTTVLSNAKEVERGYEDLAGRLRALGADIERVA
ncbi:MAG: UDP-N-acetylglucosamine 1-carboxyvinyltransferase [Candidatus Spechtbacteria bacterium]|nr:UDP-N-acetylglucosamine 1-carboxyvinyltransferase [Candidatus Spechtbacteria bacterium]